MESIGKILIGKIPVDQIPTLIGVADEIGQLKQFIEDWVAKVSVEVEQPVRWQLLSRPKYFRPLTIFACYRAVSGRLVTEQLIRAAAALEIFHNVSLIVDDILDRSRFRRGRLTLHCRFGELPALMTSGFLTAGGFKLVEDDRYSVRLLAELMQRLGVAECLQWRLRREPLGVGEWGGIAGARPRSMVWSCPRLRTTDDRPQKIAAFGVRRFPWRDDVGVFGGAMGVC